MKPVANPARHVELAHGNVGDDGEGIAEQQLERSKQDANRADGKEADRRGTATAGSATSGMMRLGAPSCVDGL
jgi:hypothetical protein